MPNMARWCCCGGGDCTTCSDTLNVTFSGVDPCLCTSAGFWDFDNPFNTTFSLSRVTAQGGELCRWEGVASQTLRQTIYENAFPDCNGAIISQNTYDLDLELVVQGNGEITLLASVLVGGFRQFVFREAGGASTVSFSSCDSWPSIPNGLACGGTNRAENGQATVVEA